MHFKFHINLNDNDYLNYNTFWTIKSPYGKKQMLKFRITIAILFVDISFHIATDGSNISQFPQGNYFTFGNAEYFT